MILPSHPIIKWVFGPVGTFVLGGVWWTMKKIFSGIKTEWVKLRDGIDRIEKIQTVQAANCLTTIQANGARTNEILEKMELQSAELTGFLKGILNKNG